MYKAYIFDLDGTLLDTLEDLKNTLNATLKNFDYPERTLAETKAFVGNGFKDLLIRATEGKAQNLDEMVMYMRAYYKDHYADSTKPYDGIMPLLENLKSKGAKTAIVSNKADFAVKELSDLYFGKLIDVAIGENEAAGVRKKPAPDSVLTAMEQLGVKKEESLFIGDSDTDFETAQNAKTDYVLVTWGFREKEYLQSVGATKFVDTPSEIEEL